MAKKSKEERPPISTSKVHKRLDRALEAQGLVRLRLWIPDADPVDGFVVARSAEWVLLASMSSLVTLDGWAAVRSENIQSVTREPVEDCFEIKVLKARDLWPPRTPEPAGVDAVRDVLETAKTGGRLVSVFREFDRPGVCWIGSVQKVTDDTLTLLEVNNGGDWKRKPTQFDLDDLTRIDFGGGYEQALQIVAGPPPRIRAAKAATS